MREPIILEGNPDYMPFSLAYKVKGGTTLYVSGATAFPLIHSHPHNEEELRPPKNIIEQTERALNNIKVVLEAAGGNITNIVKVTIFNTRMDLQDEVNEVYQLFFGEHLPARSHVGASELVGKDLMIEIEAIAVLDE